MENKPTEGLNSLPLWVQAVSIVGFPVIVALFYMLKDAGYVSSVAESNAAVMRELVIGHQIQSETLTSLVRIERAQCHIQAKTSDEHFKCG